MRERSVTRAAFVIGRTYGAPPSGVFAAIALDPRSKILGLGTNSLDRAQAASRWRDGRGG